MGERFITSMGAYLPLLRLSRKAANAALKWSGLSGAREGFRAVAGWDEDALTLAVEAARIAMRQAPAPRALSFASTSASFSERAQAPLLAEALALPATVRTFDAAGSRRCAVSALLLALEGRGDVLVAAGERRVTKMGSPAQLSFGDGGAACLVSDKGGARLIAAHGASHDLVDIYASREHPTPYLAEERFVRDVAVAEVIAPTILELCRQAGVEPAAIAYAALNEPVFGCYKAVAAKLGLTAPNVAEDIALGAGDLGAAHPLFALALALARAEPGDIVLLAGFGSGCDAALFEVVGEVAGANSAGEALASGQALTDMIRFASLAGCLDLDWGARAEFEQKVSATVLERYGRDMMGFIGGRDSHGNVQFPKSRIPVAPEAEGPEKLADVRLADVAARIVSLTADRLNFTPDPPFLFGLVQFDGGARVMMEFTDADARTLSVGDPVAMRFRVKSLDKKRGFRSWFWKAAPLNRPWMES
jgi:3-hydroxy-3-methylglutaryl CoA synthase/uncharacterized OB-fold protein